MMPHPIFNKSAQAKGSFERLDASFHERIRMHVDAEAEVVDVACLDTDDSPLWTISWRWDDLGEIIDWLYGRGWIEPGQQSRARTKVEALIMEATDKTILPLTVTAPSSSWDIKDHFDPAVSFSFDFVSQTGRVVHGEESMVFRTESSTGMSLKAAKDTVDWVNSHGGLLKPDKKVLAIKSLRTHAIALAPKTVVLPKSAAMSPALEEPEEGEHDDDRTTIFITRFEDDYRAIKILELAGIEFTVK
jgi:hypothetical protein